MILTWLDRYRDTGLLILRAGVGAMMMLHGGDKLYAGEERWTMVGGAMANFGLDFAPTAWGLVAALTEFVGGLCLVLGFLFRVATPLLLFTMITAAAHHLASGDGIQGASHAIELGFVFLGLFFTGPGRFSVDERFARRRGPAPDLVPPSYTS